MLELIALAVDVVLEHIVAGAAEQLGAAAQVVLVGAGQAFGVDVGVPDDVAGADPLLTHLAAHQVQIRQRRGVVVDVGLIQPELLLVEVAVEVLVGGAGFVAAAGGDADAGVHLRVDLAVGTQARPDALAVAVATVVRLAADVDALVAAQASFFSKSEVFCCWATWAARACCSCCRSPRNSAYWAGVMEPLALSMSSSFSSTAALAVAEQVARSTPENSAVNR